MTDNDTHAASALQFRALLELHAEACWPDLIPAADALLARPGLRPHQRALALQLQAEALQHNGERQRADEALTGAVRIAAWPLSSMNWLEQRWEHLDDDTTDWPLLCRALVRRGHGAILIRSLMAVLGRLPLAGQRQRLLDTIEASDALLLASQPALSRQWRWLRRAAPAGGNGFWG